MNYFFSRRFIKCAIFICVLYCFNVKHLAACHLPKPEIKGNDTVCENSITLYNCNFDIYKPSKWNVTNGTYFGWYSQGYYIKWQDTGYATITLTAFDLEGCAFTVQKKYMLNLQILKNLMPGRM